ncbi:unnamed protein product [Amoebophrya sp. A25]|nr:unnamed protein product [Amoebophrya sp. A25]|eukprot:GSA25T00026843001.1
MLKSWKKMRRRKKTRLPSSGVVGRRVMRRLLVSSLVWRRFGITEAINSDKTHLADSGSGGDPSDPASPEPVGGGAISAIKAAAGDISASSEPGHESASSSSSTGGGAASAPSAGTPVMTTVVGTLSAAGSTGSTDGTGPGPTGTPVASFNGEVRFPTASVGGKSSSEQGRNSERKDGFEVSEGGQESDAADVVSSPSTDGISPTVRPHEVIKGRISEGNADEEEDGRVKNATSSSRKEEPEQQSEAQQDLPGSNAFSFLDMEKGEGQRRTSSSQASVDASSVSDKASTIKTKRPKTGGNTNANSKTKTDGKAGKKGKIASTSPGQSPSNSPQVTPRTKAGESPKTNPEMKIESDVTPRSAHGTGTGSESISTDAAPAPDTAPSTSSQEDSSGSWGVMFSLKTWQSWVLVSGILVILVVLFVVLTLGCYVLLSGPDVIEGEDADGNMVLLSRLSGLGGFYDEDDEDKAGTPTLGSGSGSKLGMYEYSQSASPEDGAKSPGSFAEIDPGSLGAPAQGAATESAAKTSMGSGEEADAHESRRDGSGSSRRGSFDDESTKGRKTSRHKSDSVNNRNKTAKDKRDSKRTKRRSSTSSGTLEYEVIPASKQDADLRAVRPTLDRLLGGNADPDVEQKNKLGTGGTRPKSWYNYTYEAKTGSNESNDGPRVPSKDRGMRSNDVGEQGSRRASARAGRTMLTFEGEALERFMTVASGDESGSDDASETSQDTVTEQMKHDADRAAQDSSDDEERGLLVVAPLSVDDGDDGTQGRRLVVALLCRAGGFFHLHSASKSDISIQP